MSMIRVAIVQTNPEFGNLPKNVFDAAALIGSVEADLYVLPELFSTGYNFINRKEVEKLSEPPDGSAIRVGWPITPPVAASPWNHAARAKS